jgi:hypothetical protein
VSCLGRWQRGFDLATRFDNPQYVIRKALQFSISFGSVLQDAQLPSLLLLFCLYVLYADREEADLQQAEWSIASLPSCKRRLRLYQRSPFRFIRRPRWRIVATLNMTQFFAKLTANKFPRLLYP